MPDNVEATDEGFVAELERRGYRVAKRVQLGELGVAQTQIPLAVNQLKSAGVDLLLTMHNPIVVTSFVQQADAQGFHPTYLATDLGLMTSDLATQNMPDSYDGAVGYTVGRTNEHRQGLPEPAADAACITRIASHGVGAARAAAPAATPRCSAPARCSTPSWPEPAGPGPTSPGPTSVPPWPTVGAIELAGHGPASFARGKPDAPDAVRPLRWRSSCRCWMPSGPFVAAS